MTDERSPPTTTSVVGGTQLAGTAGQTKAECSNARKGWPNLVPGSEGRLCNPGALVRWKGGFHRVADPLRHPLDGLQSLSNPIGSAMDKIRVGLFRTSTLLASPGSLLQAEETTTLERLQVRHTGSCRRGIYAAVARAVPS